jgi:transketolase C-terminal domain/subunit
VGINDIFASVGPLHQLQDKYGLTQEGIMSAVREVVSR